MSGIWAATPLPGAASALTPLSRNAPSVTIWLPDGWMISSLSPTANRFLTSTSAQPSAPTAVDVAAALGNGMAEQVILVVLRAVAFQKPRGVASVGQALQIGQQPRIERLAHRCVVDGLAVALRSSCDVIRRLGAALDFQRIDPGVHQPPDQLDGAQVFGVEHVGAVLVLLDGHDLPRSVFLLDAVRGLGIETSARVWGSQRFVRRSAF